jgi:hypothetical protein
LGRGCLLFENGILDGDSFEQISFYYVSRNQFIENYVSEKAKHLIDTYEPETSVFIFIGQQSSTCLVAGSESGLPTPKSIWEQNKDDPLFQD